MHLYAGSSANKPEEEEAARLRYNFIICLNFKLTLTPKTSKQKVDAENRTFQDR